MWVWTHNSYRLNLISASHKILPTTSDDRIYCDRFSVTRILVATINHSLMRAPFRTSCARSVRQRPLVCLRQFATVVSGRFGNLIPEMLHSPSDSLC